jgi:hypothetical protein
VITKLVSALGDESEDVRSCACQTLGKIGEKVATNEVIAKIMTMRAGDRALSYKAANAIDGILRSSVSIIELDPKLILQLCSTKNESECLRNVLIHEVIKKIFDTQNPDWLPVLAHITFQKGAALLITEETLTVHNKTEPVLLHIQNLKI